MNDQGFHKTFQTSHVFDSRICVNNGENHPDSRENRRRDPQKIDERTRPRSCRFIQNRVCDDPINRFEYVPRRRRLTYFRTVSKRNVTCRRGYYESEKRERRPRHHRVKSTTDGIGSGPRTVSSHFAGELIRRVFRSRPEMNTARRRRRRPRRSINLPCATPAAAMRLRP